MTRLQPGALGFWDVWEKWAEARRGPNDDAGAGGQTEGAHRQAGAHPSGRHGAQRQLGRSAYNSLS